LILSPNRQYILAGFHDEKLRMINSMSWKELYAFDHSWEELTEVNSSDILNIYKECDSNDGVYYEALSRPFNVPRIPLHDQVPGVGIGQVAKRGISRIEVSFDSRFCATKCETSPKCVWIWDLVEMSLNSILVQNTEVSDMKWNPRTHNLNVCSGANRLFLWSPKGASVC
jgi:WD40 repeat protein